MHGSRWERIQPREVKNTSRYTGKTANSALVPSDWGKVFLSFNTKQQFGQGDGCPTLSE